MKKGVLVLVRHGESRMNELNRFTGWIDVPLSEIGIEEARQCARYCDRFTYDIVFTSNLERAHGTLVIILAHQKKIGIFQHEGDKRYNRLEKISELAKRIIPIYKSETLNERTYGLLQGMNKVAADRKYTKEKVLHWRRSFKGRPPQGESLEDVYHRVIPYFQEKMYPSLSQGKNVLVVAHGNTLRALIKYLENIDDDKIPFVDLPHAHPFVYTYKKGLFIKEEGDYTFERPLR